MKSVPAITIEREYGAGGGEIGRRLAKKLSVPVYGKDILEEAAALAGITPREAYQLEASESGSLARFIFGAFQLIPGVDAEEDYVHDLQAELIRSRAQAQPAVFVGRLAQDALKDTGLDYIRIFVTRPLEERIYQIEKLKDLPQDKAAQLIHQVDQSRRNRAKHHSGREWGRAQDYDLVINSGELGTDGSVAVIERFLEERDKRRSSRGIG